MKTKFAAVKPDQVLKKGSAEYLAEAILSGYAVDVYIYSDKEVSK
ncbi:MAG: hypothetical protein U9P72_02275 [Campylobacterota bacterium]|nr:hypothetical protein [Campylobacterota bacterium]